MKKLIMRLRKVLLMIGVFLGSIYTKVFAAAQVLYGPPELINPKPEPIEIILKVARGLIIPIAFIIGVIVYLKKSSRSFFSKFITILIVLVIVVILFSN